MNESKHTPGPWKASLGNLIRVFGAPAGLVVCGVHKIGVQTGEYGPEAQRECEANAHLIAAAPDMLAALKEVEEWWLCEGMSHHIGAPWAIFATRAAIAKAEVTHASLASAERCVE